MKRKNIPPSTTIFVPKGWSYLQTLEAAKRQLEEQSRLVELAIAVEHQGQKIRQLTKPKRKRH